MAVVEFYHSGIDELAVGVFYTRDRSAIKTMSCPLFFFQQLYERFPNGLPEGHVDWWLDSVLRKRERSRTFD